MNDEIFTIDDDSLSESVSANLPIVARQEEEVAKIDIIYKYIKDIQRYPLLTPEEELRLAREYYKTRDPMIGLRLVTANLRLVVKIAFEYRTYTNQILDLIQEGNVGLIQAVRHFDPLKGVRLSHYAQYWIRSYIIYYLLNNHRLVKLGTTQAQRKVFFNLRKERQRLLAMGIDPTSKVIASNLAVPESTVIEMMERMDSPELYLDAPQSHESDTPLIATLAGPSNPEEELASAEIKDRVREKMEAFRNLLKNERERIIWENRLMADKPLTLQEIGEKFGVSRERARQIEERLKKRLKDYLVQELGEEYIGHIATTDNE